MDFLLSRPGLPENFFFDSLQSGRAPAGTALPGDLGAEDTGTVVLAEHLADGTTRVFTRSEAVLQTLISLGGAWRAFAIFRLVPRGLRDGLYRWVARHRYAWFGRRDTCRLPTPAEKSRFLS